MKPSEISGHFSSTFILKYFSSNFFFSFSFDSPLNNQSPDGCVVIGLHDVRDAHRSRGLPSVSSNIHPTSHDTIILLLNSNVNGIGELKAEDFRGNYLVPIKSTYLI
jgi:hypothetical protein